MYPREFWDVRFEGADGFGGRGADVAETECLDGWGGGVPPM